MGAGEKKYQEKCLLERVRALYFDRVYNKAYLIDPCKHQEVRSWCRFSKENVLGGTEQEEVGKERECSLKE